LQRIQWITLMAVARSRFDFSRHREASPLRKNKFFREV
jgi:hypothetical protein